MPGKHQRAAIEDLETLWERDLCTLSAAEMEQRWLKEEKSSGNAIERIHPGSLAKLEHHNPIFYLAENVWFDNDPSLLDKEFHRDKICSELLAWYFDDSHNYEGVLIQAQRDSYKSTFGHNILPMFLAMRDIYVHNRDTRILLLHHKQDQASLNLVSLKTKCTVSAYLERFWNGSDGSPKFFWETDVGNMKAFDWPHKIKGQFREHSVMASGLNVSLTGLHFDYKLDDDLVTDDHIDSSVIRNDAIFKYGATQCLLDTLTGKEVNMGTPYHLRDLWANLEAQKKEDGTPLYRVVTIPAGGDRVKKALSYPSRHTNDFLERTYRKIVERDGTDLMWWLNYQCERRAPGSVVTKEEWIQYVTKKELLKKFGERGLPVIILCDPAWKGTKNSGKGCDAAIAAIGFDRKGMVVSSYLLDLAVSNEMSSQDGMNTIFQMMLRWSTPRIAIEECQGYQFSEDMKREAASRKQPLHLIDLKTQWQAKNSRIVTFIRKVESRLFYILEDCPNQEIFLQQFLDFPQLNKNDALDAVAYSADPNVADMYAAFWNTEDGDEDFFADYEEEYDIPARTRYCS